MGQVMVRYKVKPERVAENEALVRAVYDELAATQPGDIRYATFKLDDGVSFVHVAFGEHPIPLSRIAAFERFKDGLAERCAEPPVRAVMDEVGSYRL